MFPSAKAASEEVLGIDDNQSISISHSNLNLKNEEMDWLSLESFKPELVDNSNQQSTEENVFHESVGKSSSESPVQEVHKKKKKDKHKKKKKKSRGRSPERLPDKTQKEIIFKGNKVFIEEIPGLEIKDAFRVDRKSDINTWNYGSLYKGHVARYHDNLNDCVGITSERVTMKDSKRSKKYDFNRYCSKESRKAYYSIPTQKILPKPSLGDLTLEKTEIISFNSSIVNDKSIDIRDQLLDCATSLYIQGKGTENTNNDETIITEESASLFQTVAEYNRKTRENPHDIDVWMQFVEFQDKLASENLSDKKINESSLLEKKISIMKKAVDSNPGSIELKMKYLDLCKGTMSPETITKEMEQLLFIHPTNMLLWKQYLLYHQSCVSIFTVSRVCRVYHTCFSKLIGYLEGRLHTHSVTDNLNSEILDLFFQYCYFLKQVGQIEKAIACFQALIEFNLCCPLTLNDIKHEERMVIFESFWDSGVARIGETGAKGWSYWYDNKDLQPESQPISTKNLEETEQEIIKKENTKWKVWLAIELERQTVHWLPWRPDISQNETEEDCEDLDRLVLFDDICNTLVPVSRSFHSDMVTLFFKFLGVNIGNDSTLPSHCLENLQNVVKHTKIDVVKDYTVSSEVQQNFIKCLLDQMINKFEGKEKTSFILHKMYFNFDLCKNQSKKISKLKKMAKAMLSENYNRNNLLVWSAYCDILRKCGSQSEAKSVIGTALPMVNDKSQKHGQLKLYRMLTELHLGISSGENDPPQSCDLVKAQNVLICFTEDRNNVKDMTDITSTTLLRSRKNLESQCDACIEEMTNLDKLKTLSKQDLGHICETFIMYSLLEYSFGKNELELATSVLEDAVKHLYEFLQENNVDKLSTDKVKIVMENLLCYSIRLAKHHMTVNITPLSCLRNIVQHAMKILPQNNYFLQVFVEIELRMYISGRLDRYFSHVIRSEESPIPVIFAVYSILCRQSVIDKQLHQGTATVTSRGGMINRIRSYLERALSNSTVSQCPLVWRLYLHSEVQFNNLSRAKGIFYRALQACPWSKAIYFDAVCLFSGDKVEEIVDIMTEKEIRLQIPLEEVDILMEETQDKKNEEEIKDKKNEEETQGKKNEEETQDKKNEEETQDKKNEEETQDKKNEEETQDKKNEEETQDKKNEEEPK